MPQELQPLYQAASKKFNLGTYENFEKSMRDPKLRKTFYDAASKKFNLGDYNNFNSKVDSLTSVNGNGKVPEEEKLTNTAAPAAEVKPPATEQVPGMKWGRPTAVVLGRGDATAEKEWRSGQRPLTDYATADKEPVTPDAIWKTGLNVIGAKNPDEYGFIQRRTDLGRLNEFEKYKVEKEGVSINAQKISGLLDKAKVVAEEKTKQYQDNYDQLQKELVVANAANDQDWQNKIIERTKVLVEQQKVDPAFTQYNDLVTKYNELSKYEAELPKKYPMVKEQQAESQKVQQEYKEGGFWSKLYFQSAYPAMGAMMDMSKNIMGITDHLANLTGLMSNDELQDFTQTKAGTIGMPEPEETQSVFNPSTGKFQASGILPSMFKIGLQSYGFYKGGAILNKTGIPMGASQWLSVQTQTFPMFYEQGIQNGLTTNQAQAYAALSSASEATIERILPEEQIFENMLPDALDVFKGVRHLKGGMPAKIAEFTKGYMRVALPEATEEVLSDVYSNMFQSVANDMTNSDFQVQPLDFQNEAKTIVSTAIGMVPMSLVGGYNQVNNITKVSRYEAGLAPKSYIDFVDDKVANGEMTQAKADEVAGTALKMAEIIDQIPDKMANGKKLSRENKIEIANLLFEQEKLEEKKKKSNKLFIDAFDEAAADLEERLNKAYGVPVEEDAATEQTAPADEPVVATDEQTDGLDEETAAEIEGLKQDLADNAAAGETNTLGEKGSKLQWDVFGNEAMEEWTVGERTKTRGGQDAVILTKQYVEAAKDGQTYSKEYADANGIKYTNEPHIIEHVVPISELGSTEAKAKETKIETVGDKEFYSHEGNEYEVKRNKSGELEFENSSSGKPITRKSANYDQVVAGYIAEKFADAPDTQSSAESEEEYYSDLSVNSNNPLELLVAASQADNAEGGTQRASAKDLFLSEHHISFNAEDVRRHFGYDLSDMGNWQALRDNYYKSDGPGIDQSVVDMNLNEDGERFTEDDLWDFMERYPKGLDESTIMGPHTKALGERFTAITGAPFDRQMLEAFRDVQNKANRIPEADQDAMFDWFAAHPQGTIEEIKAELPLSDETKTVLDETEKFKYPWETESEQPEADKGSTDVATTETEQPKFKAKDLGDHTPEVVLENLTHHLPQFADMFNEAIDVVKQLKSIEQKAGQKLFAGINSIMPFPYAIYSKWINSNKSTEENKQRVITEFKSNLERAKDYLKNPPSDAELEKMKTDHEKKASDQDVKTKASMAVAQQKAKTVADFVKDNEAFIVSLFPENPTATQKASIASDMMDGVTKEQLLLAQRVHEVMDQLGGNKGKDKNTDFLKTIDLLMKANFNIDSLIGMIKGIGYTTDRMDRIVTALKQLKQPEAKTEEVKGKGEDPIWSKGQPLEEAFQKGKSQDDENIKLLESLTSKASDRFKEINDEKDFNKLQTLAKEIATEIYDNYLKEKNIPKDERKSTTEGDLYMINQLSYRIISAAEQKYGHVRESMSVVDALKEKPAAKPVSESQQVIAAIKSAAIKTGVEGSAAQSTLEDILPETIDAAIKATQEYIANVKKGGDPQHILEFLDAVLNNLKGKTALAIKEKVTDEVYYQGIPKTTSAVQALLDKDGNVLFQGSINGVEEYKKANGIPEDKVIYPDIDLTNPNSLIRKFLRYKGPPVEEIAPVKKKLPAAPVKTERKILPDDQLNEIGEALKNRFGINYKTVSQDEAKAILSSDREFFFGILEDIDIFDNVNPNEAKQFILKVYATVANAEEARRAYRKLSFKYHPDKGGALEIMKYLNVVNDRYNKGLSGDGIGAPRNEQSSGRNDRNTYEDFRRQQEQDFARWQERQRQQQRAQERDRQAGKAAYEEQMRQRKEKQSIYDTLTKQSREKRDKRKEDARKKRDADIAILISQKATMTTGEYLTQDGAIKKAYISEILAADKEYMADIMDATKRYKMQKFDGPMPAGFYDDATETAYFVSGVADETTPIHEAFSHPFILAVEKRNPELYDRLQKAVRKNKEIKEFVDRKYATASARAKTHEMIARAIDLEAKKKLVDKSLIDHIKDFWNEVQKMFGSIFGRKFVINKQEYTVEDIDAGATVGQIAAMVLDSGTRIDLRKPQAPVTPNAPATDIPADVDAALDDMLGGIQFQFPDEEKPKAIEVTTELLANAQKAIAAMTANGIYDFNKVIEMLSKKLNDREKVERLLPAMKQAYGAYAMAAPDEIVDKLTDNKNVRNFKLPVADERTQNIGGGRTPGTKPGSGPTPDLFSGNQSDISGAPNEVPPKDEKPVTEDTDTSGPGTEESTEVGSDGSGSTGGSKRRTKSGRSTRSKPGSKSTESGNTENADPIDPANRNFVITNTTELIPKGEMSKIRANITAIELLKELENADRNPSPEEKLILAQFTGWGGLSTVLDVNKAQERGQTSWKDKYLAMHNQIVKLLTPSELKSAIASTPNAHYTSKDIISHMWAIAERMGFKGGRVLEPAAGIGHFNGLMPGNLVTKSKMDMVELDQISGRIAKKLYPQSEVQVSGFEEARLQPASYDMTISNIPFGSIKVFDKNYEDLTKWNIHNYFIGKSMRLVKPGGLGVLITTNNTMDRVNIQDFRDYMNEHEEVDFMGAIRLPWNAFKENAGTEVTTDILIFRKRTDAGRTHPQAQLWSLAVPHRETVDEDGEPFTQMINEYFNDNPEMMMGEMRLAHETGKGGGLYTQTDNVLVPTSDDLNGMIENAIEHLPQNISNTNGSDSSTTTEDLLSEERDVEGGYYMDADGEIYTSQDGRKIYVDFENERVKLSKTKTVSVQNVFKDFITLKQLAKNLVRGERSTKFTDEELDLQRKKLRIAYENFHTRYGRINRNGKLAFLKEDSEFALAYSLENIVQTIARNKVGNPYYVYEIHPGDILQRRVNFPYVLPTAAANVSDAVNISIIYKGSINMEYIAKLLDINPDAAKEMIITERLAFVDPETGLLIDHDEYLSGNVREKLKAAEHGALLDAKFEINVLSLKEVLPPWAPMHLITPGIGSTWIPLKVYNHFMLDQDIQAQVGFSDKVSKNRFQVDYTKYADRNSLGEATWGYYDAQTNTRVHSAVDMMQAALNNGDVKVYKKDPNDPEGKKRLTDHDKTAEARLKLEGLKAEFEAWVKRTEEIHEEMETAFNTEVQGYAEYKSTRVITRFPGQAEMVDGKPFILREHQSRAAFRALRRSTYLAHDVGSGKTYTLISIALEWKRLGLANKPLIVVHNPTFEQFTGSMAKVYPGKRVLMPTKKDLTKENRQQFLASIAYGAWDAVIIPKSFLEKIPNDPDRERAMLQAEVANLEVQKQTMDKDQKTQANRDIAKLKKRIEKLGAKPPADKKKKRVKDEGRETLRDRKRFAEINNLKKDATFYFEEMGVDAILLDEADAYKKVGFDTALPSIRGIDVQRSNIAWDAFTKTRFIMQQNGGRNVVLASGTPITNTMAEMWTDMRFIAPQMLTDLGIDTFDSFAASFTHITQSLELTATGVYKELPRMREFMNLPALVAAFRTNVDVVTKDDIKEFKESNLVPKMDREQIVLEMSYATKEVIDTIRQVAVWWDNLKGFEQARMIWLPIVLYGLAKKAAVDVRLLNNKYKQYPEDPNSKLNQVAIRSAEIYHETAGDKLTQLIFCDSIRSRDGSFNAHHEIRKKLIENGVNPAEIVIADDKFDGLKRAIIMEDMNAGKIRFLIGHTEKIGVGINVQERLVALWHVDAPDLPSKMTQRNGRGVRQGNLCALTREEGGFDRPVMVKEVGVKGTMDSLAYQRLEIKGKFINQALSNFLDWGAHDDVDISDGDLQNGIMASMLADSSTGLVLRESQRILRQFEAAFNNYKLRESKLSGRVKELGAIIPALESRKPFLSEFMADLPNWMDFETTEDGRMKSTDRKITAVTIDDVVHREKFGQAIDDAQAKSIQKLHDKGRSAGGNVKVVIKFGEHITAVITNRFGAFVEGNQSGMFEGNEFTKGSQWDKMNRDKKAEPVFDPNAIGSEVQLFVGERMEDTFNFNGGMSLGNKIYGKVKDIAYDHETIDKRISDYKTEVDKIKAQIGQPFEKMEEMQAMQAQIGTLEQQLLEENAGNDQDTDLKGDGLEMLEIIQRLIADDREREERKKDRKSKKGKKESEQERRQREEDEKMDADDPTAKSDTDDEGETKGLGTATEEEDEVFMQFPDEDDVDNLTRAQERIEERLNRIESNIDSILENNFLTRDRTGGKAEQAYILPPKPIIKAALKIIRYSVKAGFGMARAFRNAYTYVRNTDWYKDTVKRGAPFSLNDMQQMFNDYGVPNATTVDQLDQYLKRIRKFVNGATSAEVESALNNLTNYITARVKTIGATDTRFFLDAIDKIRKSQGNPTRLATAIVKFEKAVDEFIYREQYREAIRAKREARRNLVKLQKFPDIRLLGMELVNLPIVKNREKMPIDLLWKYLGAINPLAVKGKELVPNVHDITTVIREVTNWANSIQEKEESDKASRDTTGSDARREEQMEQWREDIDAMKDTFNPNWIVRADEIDGDLQQMVREFVAIDHSGLEYNALKNYWGIMNNLHHNLLVSPNIYNDWVLPRRKSIKAAAVVNVARDVKYYFDQVKSLIKKLQTVPKTLWDAKILKPDPSLKYDAPFWNHFIQPLTNAIEKFRIDYQTVAGVMEKLYQRLGKNLDERAKASMQVRMWAFANQIDHNRPDIDFKSKLLQSITNMKESSLHSDIYQDYLDAYNSLLFSAPVEDGEPSLIDLEATFDAFTPAQKAFAQGLANLVSQRLQPIVQYQQMYVRGENVNFIENYHPMAVLGGVNVEEATTESQVDALLSNNGLRGTMLSTKAGSMFARTYPNKVFYSFTYPSLLDSIEGTLFDKHLTEPVKEVFGTMISGDFTNAFTSDLASEMRKQMMSMLKHEIGFNEQAKSIEQRLIDSLIRALTGKALVSIKRFAEAIPNWSVAAPHITANPYDAVKTIYNSSRNFFDHPREWLNLMRDNGFSVYMRFSTHTEMIDTPGGGSMIIHNPFLNPLKHMRESRTVRKQYDQKNKTKFDQLATDALSAFTNNDVSRMGTLIQQLSIGIGDYVSSFPIWVASFNSYLKDHGHPEWVPGGDNTGIPQEAITAAGNFAENIVDRSVGSSNRGRSAEKTYSFSSEDERKRWYAYALGRFTYFLGVLMYQQTAYFRHHATSLITGKGEYGRLQAAGVLAGLLAGNIAFNVVTKLIGAILLGLGGDDDAKKKQLADLGTKEYWARNASSALLQLTILGKLPYFSKILFSMGFEAVNKYLTEEVLKHAYNPYHDALTYSPRLPLPTEYGKTENVYKTFLPFTGPLMDIVEPIADGVDQIANGNPTDDALVKFNTMKAALAITNMMITIPFVNKEVYGVLNTKSRPVAASDYEDLKKVQKERSDMKESAKKDYEANYATMDPDTAKATLDSLILEAPDEAVADKLRATKTLISQPKYDQMTANDKFLMNYPAAAKVERIKQDINTMPSEQIKEKLEYYRNLGVISQNIYQQLMDEMYLSQHLDQMTPNERREHRYRMNQRKSK